MEVKTDIDVKDDNVFWSGAVDTLQTIRNAGKLDEWESFIESYYADSGEIPTLTEINDLLWFESEWIFDNLGISEDDDSDDDSDDSDE